MLLVPFQLVVNVVRRFHAEHYAQTAAALSFANLLPDKAGVVIANHLGQFAQRAERVTWIGLAILGATAILQMLTIERAFDAIWKVRKQRPWIKRLGLHLLALLLGPLVFGGVLASTTFLATASLGLVDEARWVHIALAEALPLIFLAQEREWLTMGAGFLIGDGRQAVAAGHVISGSEGVRVKLAGGEWRAARVVGVDLAQDVALLRIEGEPGQPATIAPAMPRQGQAIAAVGAPDGWGFSLSAGLVSRYGAAAGMVQTQPMLQIAAPIIGGNSGGPVFNAWGEAVGMVSFGKQAFNQAVPIGRVLDVADALRCGDSSAIALADDSTGSKVAKLNAKEGGRPARPGA